MPTALPVVVDLPPERRSWLRGDGPGGDFLVSCTSADRVWAEWIAWQLEAEGYQVVIQAWDFPRHDDAETDQRSFCLYDLETRSGEVLRNGAHC